MKKRTETRPETQGGNGTDPGLATALAPLVAGMTATRASLLDWVHSRGVMALQEVFATEAETLAGPKGQHQAARTHHHWGTTATELTFGGRRIQVARPRVRSREGDVARHEDGLVRAESWPRPTRIGRRRALIEFRGAAAAVLPVRRRVVPAGPRGLFAA
jgi:hypothetical protein